MSISYSVLRNRTTRTENDCLKPQVRYHTQSLGKPLPFPAPALPTPNNKAWLNEAIISTGGISQSTITATYITIHHMVKVVKPKPIAACQFVTVKPDMIK